MIHIGRFLGYILLGINAVMAALLCLSAFSPSLNPHTSPVASCAGLFFPVFLIINVAFLFFWLVVFRRYALFPILVLLVCWNSIQTYFPMNWFQGNAPEEAIKVLSYNTRGFGDMKAHTKETPNEVLKYLQNSDADIICLQEYVWGGKLKKRISTMPFANTLIAIIIRWQMEEMVWGVIPVIPFFLLNRLNIRVPAMVPLPII